MIKENNFLFRNLNENLLILNVAFFLAVPMLCSLINYDLGVDAITLTGLMSILNFFYYRKTSFNYKRGDKNKYIAGLFPYIILTIIAIMALKHPLLSEFSVIGGGSYISLDMENPNLLVSASDSIREVIFTPVRLFATISLALCIYFICDSIFLVNKVATYALIVAFACSLWGLTLHFSDIQSHLINIERLTDDSFFTFTNPKHWALYATLAIALGSLSVSQGKQRFRLKHFLTSKRFIFTFMQIVLFFTVCLMSFGVYSLLASIVFLTSILINIGDAFPSTKFDMENLKEKKKAYFAKTMLPLSFYIILSLSVVAVGVFSVLEILNTPNILEAINIENREFLVQDVAPLMESRLLFGWGVCSFSEIFAFVQSSDMGAGLWAYPYSDLVLGLLEYGIVGIVLLFIAPIFLFLRSVFRREILFASLPLIICVFVIGILMLVSNPMQNPFLQSLFIIAFFALLAWGKAELRKFI